MDILEILKENENIVRERFGVKKIGLFGSFAKGFHSIDSDIDILVEFEAPVDIFQFLDLKEFFESLFGRKVDLVTKNALKPLLTEQILSEVLYV